MKTLILIALILIALITTLLKSQTFSTITYDAGTTIDILVGADVCATNIIINGTFSGGGTICGGPLPVTLSSFNSAVNRNNVTLSWTTEVELNNSGFDIERRIVTPTGPEQWQKRGFVQGNGTTNEPKTYLFEDKKLNAGKYEYRLKQIDYNGNHEYFQLENDVVITPPQTFSISQNYPNPSNPNSKIDYELPRQMKISIKVYDITGREVAMLVDKLEDAGYHTVEFDGTNFASGVYFYRIESDIFKAVKKMVLIK